ncbi:MAG: hypothetical protein ACJASQ_003090 [Crocinitomicaceae bacterium]|jgi:hypothetical protein
MKRIKIVTNDLYLIHLLFVLGRKNGDFQKYEIEK